MSDFQPGDKVVCISDVLPCGCEFWGEPMDRYKPVIGRYYTVDLVSIGRCIAHFPVIYVEPSFRPAFPDIAPFAWPQCCFRKIEAGDTDIFKLADQPVPTPELEPS
jgi:hypothetical protein